MSEPVRLLLLALTWAAYLALHSALAAFAVKEWIARRRPRWMPAYRLAYNALALVLLAPPLWLLWRWRGEALWTWPGAWGWLADGLAAAAVLAFAWSLRAYDMGDFLGLRQLRAGDPVLDRGPLTITALHRRVRHPWYALGLVILWTRPMDPALLVTALCLTAYIVIGARLEERKLIAVHGDAYRRYRERVPALVPRPWRSLRREEAERMGVGE